MDWKSDLIKKLPWSGTISNLESKQKVADQIAARVMEGDIIGVGSGSTSYLAVWLLPEE